MREDVIHEQVLAWARIQRFDGGKVADWIHHSPNGGSRHILEAAKFKRMGVKAGFPDLFCYRPMGAWHGLFVELKAAKGRVSEAQKNMLAVLESEGYCVRVCYGFDAAREAISDYLELG